MGLASMGRGDNASLTSEEASGKRVPEAATAWA